MTWVGVVKARGYLPLRNVELYLTKHVKEDEGLVFAGRSPVLAIFGSMKDKPEHTVKALPVQGEETHDDVLVSHADRFVIFWSGSSDDPLRVLHNKVLNSGKPCITCDPEGNVYRWKGGGLEVLEGMVLRETLLTIMGCPRSNRTKSIQDSEEHVQ